MPPPPQYIATLEHAALRPYKNLRRPQDHIEGGIFVAEGEKVVRRLVNSSLTLVSFLLTSEWYDELTATESRFVQSSAGVFVAEKRLLEQIVGYRLHQGIMAVGRVPAEPSLTDLVQEGSEDAVLVVALDGLMNSENVGVLVRNCAGFGVKAVLVGETSSGPYLRRAVRNSMGAVFQLPVVHSKNLQASLKELRALGTTIVAADPKGEMPIEKMDFRRASCIVFGNEEAGVTARVLNVCDHRVSIPMRNRTDSLNVANASAVFLYEANRQRKK